MVNSVADKSAITVKVTASPAPFKTKAPSVPHSAPLQPMKRASINYNLGQERESLKAVVSNLNAQLEKGKTGLGFHINHSVSIPVVTVQDKTTGKIIRQYPNATSVSMAQSIDQLKGRIFSGKA